MNFFSNKKSKGFPLPCQTTFCLGTFKTKKEVEIASAKAEEKKYYSQTLTDRNMLFSDVVQEWLKHKKNTTKESTFGLFKNIQTSKIP